MLFSSWLERTRQVYRREKKLNERERERVRMIFIDKTYYPHDNSSVGLKEHIEGHNKLCRYEDAVYLNSKKKKNLY